MYAKLMNQIAPEVCSIAPIHETNIQRRAQMIVDNAKKLKCDRFITPADIVNVCCFLFPSNSFFPRILFFSPFSSSHPDRVMLN